MKIKELIDNYMPFAVKFGFGSKIAEYAILTVLVLGMLILLGLGTGLMEGSVDFYATKYFPSHLVPVLFFTLHYGIAVYIYVIFGAFTLITLISLIAWSAKTIKEKREEKRIFKQMIHDYKQSKNSAS